MRQICVILVPSSRLLPNVPPIHSASPRSPSLLRLRFRSGSIYCCCVSSTTNYGRDESVSRWNSRPIRPSDATEKSSPGEYPSASSSVCFSILSLSHRIASTPSTRHLPTVFRTFSRQSTLVLQINISYRKKNVSNLYYKNFVDTTFEISMPFVFLEW